MRKIRTNFPKDSKPCAYPGCPNLCYRTHWDSDNRWNNRKYCSRRCGAASKWLNHNKPVKKPSNNMRMYRMTLERIRDQIKALVWK